MGARDISTLAHEIAEELEGMSEWKVLKTKRWKLFKYESWGKAKRLIILEKKKEEIIDVYKIKKILIFFILGNGTNVLFTDDYMDRTLFVQKKLNKIEDLGNNLVKSWNRCKS